MPKAKVQTREAWANRVVRSGEMPAAQFLAHPLNARRHPGAQRDALRGSLDAVGWVAPVIVSARSGKMLDGHARVEEALSRDEAQLIPFVEVDVSEDEERLILATFDPIAGLATYDRDALEVLLADLNVSDGLQAMLDDLAAQNGLDKPVGGGGDEFDTTPDDGPTRTSVGDLWVIGGKHRLVCGDATDAATVARLMAGEKAALCLTDPPYAVGLAYASMDDTIANLSRLIAGFLPLARDHSECVMLTSGNGRQWLYPPADWIMAWVVPAGTGVTSHGFSCWHPVLFYGADPYLARGLGSRPDTLVKTESAPDFLHPCPKPLEVWQWWLLRGSVSTTDLIYDPFLGSGTTLIAAHREGRTCYGIEIEPRYCDVILKRAEAEGLECVREGVSIA